MFSPELLGETVIVGLLIILAVCIPFLLHPAPSRITQMFARLDSLNSTGVAAVLLLVLVYSVGLVGSLMANDFSAESVTYICTENTAGNHLVKWAGEDKDVCGNLKEPDEKLKQWITLYNDRLQQLKDGCKSDPDGEACKMYNGWLSEGTARGDFVKIAETALKERDEPTRMRLDREKAYVRISQGAALAFFLLIISTTVAVVVRYVRDRYWPSAAEPGRQALRTETVKTETVETEALKPEDTKAGAIEPNEAHTRRTAVWTKRLIVTVIVLLYLTGIGGVIFCFKEYLDTESKYEELVVHLYGGLRPKPLTGESK